MEPKDDTATPGLLDQLDELLDLEGEDRAARLEAIRAATPALARELEELLAADAEANGPLERLADLVASTAEELLTVDPELPPPTQLGAWRLVSRIGRGGMGEVWLGERQAGGFAQRAAIKVVRAGLASEAIVSRFVLERQVLARLSHPAIAQLLDGGLGPDARPWFAMELVEGEPITTACAELELERRIELVLRLCEAVELAHRHLVVHRDIKPSNVLVTADGEVKLLDFGLAKILGEAEDTGLTRTEMRVLTPAYAAPEQVLGEPVTTATDVYSLGVLLYEVLTGELPFQRSAGSSVKLAAEVESEVAERPSARLRRRSSVSPHELRLARRLSGDLDTIVLVALRREPTRRYPSVAALAEDLRRAIQLRPISARPDSFGYRTSRFVRRHLVGVVTGSLAVLSLAGGLAATLVQADRARAAAGLATAEASRAEAEAERARAETERANRIKDFLLSVFREASPLQRARGEPLSLEELLDAAEARIATELQAEPLLQADLWDDLAETRAANGDFEAADRLIQKALEAKRALLDPDDASLAESLANRGVFALFRGRHTEALVDLDEADRILRGAGRDHSRLGAEIATNRTNALLQAGRAEEALTEARRAFALHGEVTGLDHVETWMQLSNVAMIEMRLERPAAAAVTFERVIAGMIAASDDQHALLVYPLRGLGRAQEAVGDPIAAEASHRRALALAAARLGPSHTSTGLSQLDVARLEITRGELAEGRPRLEQAVTLLRSVAPHRRELADAELLLASLEGGRASGVGSVPR